MTYAIEMLKEKFDNRSKRMLAALKRANRSKGTDQEYYSTRYIELERQVKDLEKALEVLMREKENKAS